MYSGKHAINLANRPAFIMAKTGEAVTCAELEASSNKLAHLLRAQGLCRGDHYAVFMENNARFIECCGAGARSGLYYTCINYFLTADEVAYIINNSQSQLLITSEQKRDVALKALEQCPNTKLCLIADGPGDGDRLSSLVEATAKFPITTINDEAYGAAMLYSSGTTGRPKGIVRPLPDIPPDGSTPYGSFIASAWQIRDDMVYLSPAPLYHAAPHGGVNLTIRQGGTAVIMDRFDPERFLQLIEEHRVTHTQLVPTMFSRLLKLPEDVRNQYDVSSLEIAIHAAAPCPIPIKEQMIDWWGPVIYEYYGTTEGLGFADCTTEEWLAHKGTVGRVRFGELSILDDDFNPCPTGTAGKLWFKSDEHFEYFNDPEKTAESRTPDGTKTTVGDIGYLDENGYLYLTDRASFMIISGGVNVYPQEAENLLITHPKVSDAAVFGVPNTDLGEEVKAVVQLMPEESGNAETEEELIEFCKEHLASIKCPRSIEFEKELPRSATGKLYKRILRDRYWTNAADRNK